VNQELKEENNGEVKKPKFEDINKGDALT